MKKYIKALAKIGNCKEIGFSKFQFETTFSPIADFRTYFVQNRGYWLRSGFLHFFAMVLVGWQISWEKHLADLVIAIAILLKYSYIIEMKFFAWTSVLFWLKLETIKLVA